MKGPGTHRNKFIGGGVTVYRAEADLRGLPQPKRQCDAAWSSVTFLYPHCTAAVAFPVTKPTNFIVAQKAMSIQLHAPSNFTFSTDKFSTYSNASGFICQLPHSSLGTGYTVYKRIKFRQAK